MYTSLVLRKLKTDFAALTNISTLVPGSLQEGQNTQTGNPYARCEVTVEKQGYKSDQARYAIYAVLVEIYADNSTATNTLTLEQTLESLLTASKTGTMGGGGGEPTGSVSYAWEKTPGNKNLMTSQERRAGKSIVCIRLAMVIRVEWS